MVLLYVKLLMFWVVFVLFPFAQSQTVSLISGFQKIRMIEEGKVKSNFLQRRQMNCSPLDLYIYQDLTLRPYQIQFIGIQPNRISGKIKPIQSEISCQSNNCNATIYNRCRYHAKNQINIVQIKISGYPNINYIVNCSPFNYYKPFEWGLFFLILICTIIITVASKYSHAWSYGGFAININVYWVVSLTFIAIICSVLSLFLAVWFSKGLKIFGSLMGTLSVMVCVVQGLWLTKYVSIKERVLGRIRYIDIIGGSIGIIVTFLYWITKGNWIINNVLAICTVVTCIKFFKLRSLQMGIAILSITLIIEIFAGLFVHYVIKQSYNNLVINLFSSPVIIQLPSITPQIFRRCAWMPLTNVIFPGLLISYLRRFDMTRSSNIYLIFGYFSYYLGSLLWMIIDMMTIHTLPIALISDTFMLIILFVVSIQRNDFKILWKGTFYDEENPDIQQQLLLKKSDVTDLTQLTKNLKIDHKGSEVLENQAYSKSRITI